MVLVAAQRVGALDVLRLGLRQDGGDVLLGVLDVLDTHDTTEEDILRGVGCGGWDDTGAIDQVDALHEGDVLPDLGLSGDGSDGADLLVTESVDDGGFAGVGVADEADRNLLTVGVEAGELAEELDEGALAKGVGDGGMECEGRVIF